MEGFKRRSYYCPEQTPLQTKTIRPLHCGNSRGGQRGKVIASTKRDNRWGGCIRPGAIPGSHEKSPNQAYISQPCYDPYLDANCMFIAAPIISRNSNEPIGVIISAYNPAILNEVTLIAPAGARREVYLVNRDK